MKKFFFSLTLVFSFCFNISAQEAKVISDCTVLYKVSIEDAKADSQVVKAIMGTTKAVYIKGSKSRSDLVTPRFKQTTLFDLKSDSTIILRELGNTKYISYLNESKRREQNRKYEGIQFNNTSEKKTILGYECVKVVAKLADGSSYNVYYTPSIVPSNKEYEYQFKDLPGFVLEYEAESVDGKTKLTFSASQITLVPVPIAKFDVPKSGYRVL
jgi:GLPGLI family protein